MSSKRNGFHFDIPIPVIVIAFLFSFPIGVILTVLRVVSSNKGKNESRGGGNADGAVFDPSSFGEKQAHPEGSVFTDTIREDRPKKNKKGKKGKQKRSLGTILSSIFCVIFFLIGVLSIPEAFSDGINKIFGNLVGDVVPYMTISGICYLFSLFFKNKDGRLNRIRALIGDRDSIRLSKIAAISRQSLKKVRRDVQFLIDKGEYGDEAYIDLGTDCFMRSMSAEMDMSENTDPRFDGVENPFGSEKEKKEDSTSVPDHEDENSQFRTIILEIRRLNDEIHDFAVSERIYRIEEYTQFIFDYVTDHPEAMPKIRTFMNYYLPTTLKLLESYSRIEKMGAAGENMQSSKKKIEDILDILVEGYKQQMDHLFQNESMDISSEIKVLETMMQKDGLSGGKDFSKYSDVPLGGAAAKQAPDEKKYR